MKKNLAAEFLIFTLFLLTGCISASIPEYSVLENGDKTIAAKSELTEGDFKYRDFFVENIRNSYIPNFNEIIFSYIKNNCSTKNRKWVSYGEDIKKPSYKECIQLSKEQTDDNEFVISYIKPSKYVSGYAEIYYFKLIVDKDSTNKELFSKQLSNIRQLEEQKSNITQNIENYEWTINNCQAATIEKSRVVSVPKQVTKRRYHEPITSNYGVHNGGFQVIEEGYWEEYTVTEYVKETQHYTEPNPNYNPQAVSNAKKMLPVQQQKLQETNQNISKAIAQLRNLVPYKVYALNFEQ
ncbi:MAG: hypothetical protein J6Y60_04990 [Treponema sp.]|nr:hypothetical protein [Treponema sp.]